MNVAVASPSERIAGLSRGSAYEGYAYAYPHKTAYRRFARPMPLRDVWDGEDTRRLFAYVHIPYCRVRCGFCNLFATTGGQEGELDAYLGALDAQAHVMAETLHAPRFSRLAVGGGTPSLLSPGQVERLFTSLERRLGIDAASIPVAVEVSPDTVDRARLDAWKRGGVDRISIGIQSFVPEEAHAVGRPQRENDVLAALDLIRTLGFAVLNLDLIYGIPGQTAASWEASLRQALTFAPEELYLYPLYTRPLTALGTRMSAGRERPAADVRMSFYRIGRDVLRASGYRQVSMRMFTKEGASPSAPDYRCQEDGMVGLGVGARSYTRNLHHSGEYAINRQVIRSIVADYVAQDDASRRFAWHGFALDGDEQRRRFVIQSLLQADGLRVNAYTERFATDPFTDLPVLKELLDAELATNDGGHLRLSDEGMALSDRIGPLLYSPRVRDLMEGHAWQ